MTSEQIEKIEKAAERDIQNHPYLRKGQAIFNLVSVILDTYDQKVLENFKKDIVGSDKDPFYKDENLKGFYEYLKNEIPDK